MSIYLPRAAEQLIDALEVEKANTESNLAALKAMLLQAHSFPRVSPFQDEEPQALCQYDIFCGMQSREQNIRVYSIHHIKLAEDTPKVWLLIDPCELKELPATIEDWDNRAKESAPLKMYIEFEREHVQRYRLGNIRDDWSACMQFVDKYTQLCHTNADFFKLRGACTSFFPKSSLAKRISNMHHSGDEWLEE